jgi:hypothetical protein
MPDLFDRRAAAPAIMPAAARPDPAFAARPRLVRLCAALDRAARRPAHWNAPAAFFFDPARQAQLEAARPAPPDPFAEVAALVAAELPLLLDSVEVRRTARAVPGLARAAAALAPRCGAARDLADLLAVPDDEVFLALDPRAGTGARVYLRGAAEVAHLYRLLAPAAVQLFAPAALAADGTLPAGFAGCGHWLWPTQALAAVPRVNGTRVVLIGPATVRHAPAVEPRFPALAVDAQHIAAPDAAEVADVLTRLGARPAPAVARERAVARAA